MKTVIMATVLGAALGLALGVTAAFFHVNVRSLTVWGVAASPSISGVVLGGTTGFVIGLITFIRSRAARRQPAARD